MAHTPGFQIPPQFCYPIQTGETNMALNILGIETSCDETAVGVVADGRRMLSNVIASQVHLHAPYGGIVPEVASRQHVRDLTPALDMALSEAGLATGGRRPGFRHLRPRPGRLPDHRPQLGQGHVLRTGHSHARREPFGRPHLRLVADRTRPGE